MSNESDFVSRLNRRALRAKLSTFPMHMSHLPRQLVHIEAEQDDDARWRYVIRSGETAFERSASGYRWRAEALDAGVRAFDDVNKRDALEYSFVRLLRNGDKDIVGALYQRPVYQVIVPQF